MLVSSPGAAFQKSMLLSAGGGKLWKIPPRLHRNALGGRLKGRSLETFAWSTLICPTGHAGFVARRRISKIDAPLSWGREAVENPAASAPKCPWWSTQRTHVPYFSLIYVNLPNRACWFRRQAPHFKNRCSSQLGAGSCGKSRRVCTEMPLVVDSKDPCSILFLDLR